MSRVFKVFARGPEQKELTKYGPVLASYDAFAIVEPARGKARAMQRRFPSEDISSQYELPVARGLRKGKAKRRANGAVSGPTRGPHHYLVQFVGPVKRQWLSAVKKQGGQPREPYRDFAYVVRADLKTAQALLELPFVRWVGHLPHEARLTEPLRARNGQRPETLSRTRIRPGVYTIQVFDPKLATSVAKSAKKLGFEILSKHPDARTLVVEAKKSGDLSAKQAQALSAIHGVKSIRRRALKRTSNDVATTLMGTRRVNGSSLRLSGLGEIVAVCDTGLDTGELETIHPDFAGRIVAIKSYPISDEFEPHVFNPGADDGPADFDSGHGTHVAGSVLGDGTASAGVTGKPIRALAHRAKLVFQAVEQEMWWRPHVPQNQRERYVLAGIPTDLSELFAYAHRKGARIHSNSWGGGDPGDYDEQCEQLDRFVWGKKDFCVLVAAGNDGTDRDGDGRINPKSVTSPGTAKNCITVGASESRRPEFNTELYGEWWPDDYPVAPFHGDPMADDPEQIVAFSSRGPTDDQRIKPDIVAPGTFILSTRSTMIASNNTAWAAFPSSHSYFFMGGTSMATPLVAGAVALVREYLRKKRRVRKPSAALVKATLVAGARRLPGTAPAGTIADNHQGFGRVDLDAVLARKTLFREIRSGLSTGESYEMLVQVASGQARLRVTLAYSDFPGPALVNNLNLILTAPDGRKFTAAGATSGGALVLDDKNNVEVVHVKSPQAGTWRIDVVASNAPQGPQDFALVVLGATKQVS